jgi:hypothetical protein
MEPHMNAPQTPDRSLIPQATRAARVQKLVSKNGVEAWLVEDYAVPLVAMEFAFAGGSSQDAPGRMGASSMLAALMDEGAGDLDSEAFHNAMDDKAIEISFSSDSDTFHGRLKTMTRNIDAALATSVDGSLISWASSRTAQSKGGNSASVSATSFFMMPYVVTKITAAPRAGRGAAIAAAAAASGAPPSSWPRRTSW